MMQRTRWLSVVVMVLAAACSGQHADDQIVVFAAASLDDVFAQFESDFEQLHPGVDVIVSTAGSATLREQLLNGAPADVFAPANETIMDTLSDAGLTSSEHIFATNSLVLAYPSSNPGHIISIDDLANRELLIGLCAEGVPCGDLAVLELRRLGIAVDPDTYEPDVRSLLRKITSGDLDAGLIYRTDALSAGDNIGVVSWDEPVTTRYPIAALNDRHIVTEFVAFVLSAESQDRLEAMGFGIDDATAS